MKLSGTEDMWHWSVGFTSYLFPLIQAFHLTLDMMTPETHKTVSEVIESCRVL